MSILGLTIYWFRSGKLAFKGTANDGVTMWSCKIFGTAILTHIQIYPNTMSSYQYGQHISHLSNIKLIVTRRKRIKYTIYRSTLHLSHVVAP